jgi:hypothetical protein
MPCRLTPWRSRLPPWVVRSLCSDVHRLTTHGGSVLRALPRFSPALRLTMCCQQERVQTTYGWQEWPGPWHWQRSSVAVGFGTAYSRLQPVNLAPLYLLQQLRIAAAWTLQGRNTRQCALPLLAPQNARTLQPWSPMWARHGQVLQPFL